MKEFLFSDLFGYKYFMKKNILFDLDGTLTDSKRGIINSCCYALDHMNMTMVDRNSADWLIGPALSYSFQHFFHFKKEETQKAVGFYREYFSQKGLYENDIYPNMRMLLRKLSDKNLYVATGKPEIFAKRILAHFKLDHYFIDICGTTLTEERTTKFQVIEYVLQKNALPPADTVMVGDRIYDMEGAKDNNISAIGVLYGYGKKEEFQKADGVANTVEELWELLR